MRRNFSHKLIETCKETPSWCPSGWAPTWRLLTSLYKFVWKVSPHILHKKNSCDLKLGGSVCIFTFFLFSESGLNLLNGFDFYFHQFWMATQRTSNWRDWRRKGPKTASSNFRDRLKFGKVSRKDLLCTKMWKKGIREFHHSGTLRVSEWNRHKRNYKKK